jgi:ribosomal protein S18 acetylase RimI-like enzyme
VTPVDEAAELAAADANLIASLRAPARWQGAAAELRDDGGLLVVAGATRFPGGLANFAARLDQRLAPAEALARAAAFFVARQRGFSLYLREPCDGDLIAATSAAELTTLATMPWMTLPRPLPETAPPDGVTLRFSDGDGDGRQVSADAAAVCAEAYESMGLPPAVTASLFGAPAGVDPASRVVVAYVEGVAAATARLEPGGGVAGVYWVATRPALRGRGLGEACTRAVTNAGFAAGARFAVLQASPMGAPIYARLGFVTRWQCRWVLVTRDQARALAG